MKYKYFIFVSIVLLLNSSIAYAQKNADVTRNFYLRADNVGFFAFAGDFNGDYQVSPNEIKINLTAADIYLRDNVSYRGRRNLSDLTVGLARTRGGRWEIIKRSARHEINKIMAPNETTQINNVAFSISLDDSVKLSECWLVFEIAGYILDSGESRAKTRGTAYSHFPTNMFSKFEDKTAVFAEDCILYDPNALEIVNLGSQGWRLVEKGTHWMAISDNESDARAILALAKRHTQVCYIGRNNRRANRQSYIQQYWK